MVAIGGNDCGKKERLHLARDFRLQGGAALCWAAFVGLQAVRVQDVYHPRVLRQI
ncbi:MAG TPA: hypothetical protein VKB88_37140 [Bryobacteraceae bacterium]|nr:hypothetical protein [Bryobacteraceae bacterium]